MEITGRKFVLYVTHAEASVNGWLSVWGHEDKNYLSSIQTMIGSLWPELRTASRHEIRQAYNQHDIVCVSMSSDKDVRGRIIRLEEASNTASVYLIDLGKKKTVILDNIKIIPDNDKGRQLRAIEEKLMDYILANIVPIASKWNEANLYSLKIRLESGGIPVECYSTKKYPRLLRCELDDSLLMGLAEEEVIHIMQPKNIEKWLLNLDPSGLGEEPEERAIGEGPDERAIVEELEGLAIGPPDGAGGDGIIKKRFKINEDVEILNYVLAHCQRPQDASTVKLFDEAAAAVQLLSRRSGRSLYDRFHRYIRPKIDQYTDDRRIVNLWKPQIKN